MLLYYELNNSKLNSYLYLYFIKYLIVNEIVIKIILFYIEKNFWWNLRVIIDVYGFGVSNVLWLDQWFISSRCKYHAKVYIKIKLYLFNINSIINNNIVDVMEKYL